MLEHVNTFVGMYIPRKGLPKIATAIAQIPHNQWGFNSNCMCTHREQCLKSLKQNLKFTRQYVFHIPSSVI